MQISIFSIHVLYLIGTPAFRLRLTKCCSRINEHQDISQVQVNETQTIVTTLYDILSSSKTPVPVLEQLLLSLNSPSSPTRQGDVEKHTQQFLLHGYIPTANHLEAILFTTWDGPTYHRTSLIFLTAVPSRILVGPSVESWLLWSVQPSDYLIDLASLTSNHRLSAYEID